MLSSCRSTLSTSENDLAQIVVVSNDSTSSSSVSSILLPELSQPGDTARWTIEYLKPKDLNAVQRICRDSFPLDYPESWFQEVVAGRFIAFGVFHGEILTSLLVAEIKRISECDQEDRDLVRDPDTLVCYILSLAVSSEYRRRGIASFLLDHLMKFHVNSPPFPKIVFLHVLHSNLGAINFYKKSGFQHHTTLQNYYLIGEVYEAGCTFVLNTNRSTSSGSIKEMFNFICAFLCKPFRSFFRPKIF
uniref:N-alpha-acetyltransferase 60 n=1 Tax=Panagrolaimus sp. JU765 TaxID=591449 RepID=A0AC34QJ83_9BILA